MDDDITVNETAPKYKPAAKPVEKEYGKRYEIIHGVPYEMVDHDYREIIHGVIYAMASPSPRHQEVKGRLYNKLFNYLTGKTCKVFDAPLDVFLKTDEADTITVQPDIFIVCDRTKITDKGCNGAPDMVIEILSPSSARRDLLEKTQLYEQYGVREYWIADPEKNMLTVYTLENGKYFVKAYSDTDRVLVGTFEDCNIDLTDVFSE